MNESDLGYAGGGPGNTDNKWGKDPKFSWWEKLVIVGIVLTVALVVSMVFW
jgi:hypothetical protein